VQIVSSVDVAPPQGWNPQVQQQVHLAVPVEEASAGGAPAGGQYFQQVLLPEEQHWQANMAPSLQSAKDIAR